jgi:hypothetical protein
VKRHTACALMRRDLDSDLAGMKGGPGSHPCAAALRARSGVAGLMVTPDPDDAIGPDRKHVPATALIVIEPLSMPDF